MSLRGGLPGHARLFWLAVILLPLSLPLRAQAPLSPGIDTARVLRLISENRIEEAESYRGILASLGCSTAEVDLALGMALLDARSYGKSLSYLESAWPRGQSPALAKATAYAAFMAEDWGKAERYAKVLLERFHDVETAAEILGSIALIRDDLAQSLFYWNRVGKPVLFDISFTPRESADILRPAFPVHKGRIFRVRDWYALEDWLARLAFVRNHSLLLMPRADGLYDLQVRVEMKPAFFDSPVDFLASEIFQVLQSQFRLEWNRIGGTRNSLGLLYRFQDYRKALSLSWTHSLAFASDIDFHLAYLRRDETWFPESSQAASFRQSLVQAEAVGRFFGGENDRAGSFLQSLHRAGSGPSGGTSATPSRRGSICPELPAPGSRRTWTPAPNGRSAVPGRKRRAPMAACPCPFRPKPAFPSEPGKAPSRTPALGFRIARISRFSASAPAYGT